MLKKSKPVWFYDLIREVCRKHKRDNAFVYQVVGEIINVKYSALLSTYISSYMYTLCIYKT